MISVLIYVEGKSYGGKIRHTNVKVLTSTIKVGKLLNFVGPILK